MSNTDQVISIGESLYYIRYQKSYELGNELKCLNTRDGGIGN